ncbi:MAG: 50S ribosomal protein L7/L12 [Chlamydiales bacterium]|nr:50S ribosomal protein L7/L12 [Chlamydiales bacterium]MCH9619177.1 50S ribosomal protein L7/L12 [Chlamydiales bacterium]MCH9622439.1 50S ribosomal protein L7/L12 [Chlamydiales bacterium]
MTTKEENLDKIVETLSNLKVVELAKLKTLLEETWDVTAAAPAAVAVAAAPAAGGEAAADATDFQVSLAEAPADKKIAVIKVIREITGLGLKEAKEIAENAPKVLKESAPKAEADEIMKKLEAAGAKGALKGL